MITMLFKYFQGNSRIMKVVIWLVAIFALCTESRYSALDRQWLPEDARQNCTINCYEECTECLPYTTCDLENENYCGDHPPEIGPDCPPSEVCVPKPCSCKLDIISLKVRQNFINVRNIKCLQRSLFLHICVQSLILFLFHIT